MTNASQPKGANPFFLIVSLPFVAILFIFFWLSWIAAKKGREFSTVKILLLPATLLISNFVFMPFFIAGAFVATLLSGNKELFVYAFNNIGDLTCLSKILYVCIGEVPEFTIPIWHTAIYQIVVYSIIGKRVARHFALVIKDLAIFLEAAENQSNSYNARKMYKLADAGYRDAALFYDNRRTAPFLGVFVILAAGGNPDKFYAD